MPIASRKPERIYQLTHYLFARFRNDINGGHNAGSFMVVGCARYRDYWSDADTRYLIRTTLTAAQCDAANFRSRSKYRRRAYRLRPEGKLVATTILIALVICMFLSKLHGNQPPKSMELDARAVRIVDPAFCNDQTWPYIDQRCLKRIDASDGAANNESVVSPATNFQPNAAQSGMPPSVPGTVNVSSNAATAATPSQAVTPQPITPHTPGEGGPAPTVVVPPVPPAGQAL